MALESDAKFEENLTCGLENYMKNLANFHQSIGKSQNWKFGHEEFNKQGIIQKRSASGSRTLPFVIFSKKVPFLTKVVLF